LSTADKTLRFTTYFESDVILNFIHTIVYNQETNKLSGRESEFAKFNPEF